MNLPNRGRTATITGLTAGSAVFVLSIVSLISTQSPVGAGAEISTAPVEALVANSQTATSRVRLPPPAGQFDYQLGGSYPPTQGTEIVSRDRTDKPEPGIYNICYINAYQTQPEETSWWRQNYPELLLRNRAGYEVVDPDWPSEVLFDIRTKAKRT